MYMFAKKLEFLTDTKRSVCSCAIKLFPVNLISGDFIGDFKSSMFI